MYQLEAFEQQNLLAGIDEAGRGPLAGPVVAAAVILHPKRPVDGLADSKKLTPGRRELIAKDICQRALSWNVSWADPSEIDAINVLSATMLAMRRAILGLAVVPDCVAVDGNRLPDLGFERFSVAGHAIVGGDDKIASISAASILAKTTRDRIMRDLDSVYPDYEFARHKGYPTELHRRKLFEIGPCSEHRRSFAPVRAAC